MKLAVDVYYDKDRALVAGMVFDDRADGSQRSSHASFVDHVSEYIPGQFYRRELPCILRLLDEHALAPEYILIDGYVYLDGHSRPGLGKYLYDVLQHKVKIIGIARNPSMSITREYEVYRGRSRRPLYVTCAGEQLSVCKRRVETMSGAHRHPALLKQVDQLSRKPFIDKY